MLTTLLGEETGAVDVQLLRAAQEQEGKALNLHAVGTASASVHFLTKPGRRWQCGENHRMAYVGRDLNVHLVPTYCRGLVALHQTSMALNASRDGTSTASLGLLSLKS